VPDEQIPPDAPIDEVNARLSDGLKTCRSMVANYKALLLAEQDDVEAPSDINPADSAAADAVRKT
jgi:hypothetical protein